MMSFINNMFNTSKFSKWEDTLSRKGVLRATASGMHSTANKLRSAADYIDSKACLLEAKADQLEMNEVAAQISKAMGEVVPQDVVRIPTDMLNNMSTSEAMKKLGIELTDVA